MIADHSRSDHDNFFLILAIMIVREGVRNLILVYQYPTLIRKFVGIFFGEIHTVNPEILVYPRIHRIHH